MEKLTLLTGGVMADTPEELFAAVSQAAMTRHDLTVPLTIAALGLFVLDVAQRRLPWEKWLARQEKPEAVPEAPKKKQTTKKPAAKKDEQGQTADALWQAMRKKKRM